MTSFLLWTPKRKATRPQDGCVQAPVSQLPLGHSSGTLAIHDAHPDAHSDPGHRGASGERAGVNATCPVPQVAQRRISHTSEGEHETRHREISWRTSHKHDFGHEYVPDVSGSTYRDRVSGNTLFENNHVYARSRGTGVSGSNHTGRSMLWQELRDKHAEVIAHRMSLREARTAISAMQKLICDAEAQLIPAMTAALTDYSIPSMKDTVDAFRALQTLRLSLRSDSETYEEQERQLFVEEDTLAEMETKVFAELQSSPEFPGGFLDFTTDNYADTASVKSDPAHVPPEKQEYDRCLRQVDVIRERLLDMQSENEQLLREQEQRERVGRSLDEYSLQLLNQFSVRNAEMNSELDRAQAKFEVAEVNWKSRRKTIEQDNDKAEVMPAVAYQELSNTPDFYNFDEDAHDSLDSLVETDERASAIAFKLFQTENEPRLVFNLPSDAEDGETINQARFISQWLLHQVHQSPAETKRFAKLLAGKLPSSNAQVLVDDALAIWMQDGTEEDFITNVKKGADSKAQSLSRAPSEQRAGSEGDSTHT